MASVSIIGAGNVGVTLGLLFQRQGHRVQDICNRSLASAEKAVEAIGAGRAVGSFADMQPVDIVLIATSDNALQTIANDLGESPALRPGTIAFHCSGATQSEVLSPLRDKGAAIACVHPVQTFTDPVVTADRFSGVWCGIEGDEAAVGMLSEIFQSFGGNVFPIKADKKVLYHTAIVFASNYLFPLIEAALICYQQAGVPRDLGAQILAPSLHAAVDNALRLGPGKAITGPIARGDDKIVFSHLKALEAFDPDLKIMYEVMGSFATRLALEKGVAPVEKIAEIQKLLNTNQYLKAVS